jgi:hypothetical protein
MLQQIPKQACIAGIDSLVGTCHPTGQIALLYDDYEIQKRSNTTIVWTTSTSTGMEATPMAVCESHWPHTGLVVA